MWGYGARSQGKLDTCHQELQDTFDLYRQWQVYEITIVHGWRGEEVQNDAFFAGNSTKKWPLSKHNKILLPDTPMSDAVDFAPWCFLPSTGQMGIPWNDTHAFAIVGGLLLAASQQLGYNSRYGGDWDMDGLTTDQTLMDWGHFERMT